MENLTTSIIDRINAIQDPSIKITVEPDFKDLPLKVPSQTELDTNLDQTFGANAKYIKETAELLRQFVETPIVTYPTKNPVDSVIDEIDQKIRAMFPTKEEKLAVNELLNHNRMRPNKLGYVPATLDLIVEMLSDFGAPEVLTNNIIRVINGLTPLVDTANDIQKSLYKKQPPYKKVKIVKEYTKASEMALRLLNGEELSSQDWETLENK